MTEVLTTERTTVDVTSADRHDHVDGAWQGLLAWCAARMPHPPLYLRGDRLARVARDEGHVKLAPHTRTSLTELAGRACAFVKRLRDNVVVQVPAPGYVADTLLHRTPEDLPGAPRIHRIVEVPVFAADGSVLLHPGYHEAARAYFQPAPGVEHIAGVGGWEASAADERYARGVDVDEARALLLELVCDFPFADEASRAHSLCMLLEPFVRELVGDAPTPMYLVYAHEPGTGKGLLITSCLSVANGRVAASALARDDEEVRKHLTAVFNEGRSVLWFDNVGHAVDSSALAAALTSPRWEGRILGQTLTVNVPVRNQWVMAANNPQVTRELTRRMIPIHLAAGDTSPLLRNDWTHPLPQWAFERRTDLVRAALTLVAHYLTGETSWSHVDAEGMPDVSRAQTRSFLGSYEEWSRVMGGVLEAAGIPGFLANLDRLHADADTDTSERGAFLREWHQRQEAPLLLDELAAFLLGVGTTLPGVTLPLELRGGNPNDFERRLGYWLRDHRSETVDGHRIARHGKDSPYRWSVERVAARVE